MSDPKPIWRWADAAALSASPPALRRSFPPEQHGDACPPPLSLAASTESLHPRQLVYTDMATTPVQATFPEMALETKSSEKAQAEIQPEKEAVGRSQTAGADDLVVDKSVPPPAIQVGESKFCLPSPEVGARRIAELWQPGVAFVMVTPKHYGTPLLCPGGNLNSGLVNLVPAGGASEKPLVPLYWQNVEELSEAQSEANADTQSQINTSEKATEGDEPSPVIQIGDAKFCLPPPEVGARRLEALWRPATVFVLVTAQHYGTPLLCPNGNLSEGLVNLVPAGGAGEKPPVPLYWQNADERRLGRPRSRSAAPRLEGVAEDEEEQDEAAEEEEQKSVEEHDLEDGEAEGVSLDEAVSLNHS